MWPLRLSLIETYSCLVRLGVRGYERVGADEQMIGIFEMLRWANDRVAVIGGHERRRGPHRWDPRSELDQRLDAAALLDLSATMMAFRG